MDNDIFEKIQGVVKEVLQKNNIVLGPETSSKDVEGWDSLRHVMIITAIENHFDIMIDFEDVMEMKTLGDIYRVVEKKLK